MPRRPSPLLLSTALTLTLALVGCSHTDGPETQDKQESFLKIANTMRANGNHKTAHDFYLQVLEKDPENLEAHVKIASMLRETNQSQEALKHLQKAAIFHPDNSLLGEEFVKTFIALNQGANAEAEARKLIDNESNNAAYHNLLGVALDTQGKHQRAQESYKKSLSITPDQNLVESNLGLSEALSSKTESAITRLKKVTTSPNATAQDRQNLAIAYALSGDLDQADALFRVDMTDTDANSNRSYFSDILKNRHQNPSSENPVPTPIVSDAAPYTSDGFSGRDSMSESPIPLHASTPQHTKS